MTTPSATAQTNLGQRDSWAAGMAKANVPIFIVHGDSDKVVPLEENSGVVEGRYQELGGKVDVEVVPGAGHQVIDAFFKSKNLIEFLIKHS